MARRKTPMRSWENARRQEGKLRKIRERKGGDEILSEGIVHWNLLRREKRGGKMRFVVTITCKRCKKQRVVLYDIFNKNRKSRGKVSLFTGACHRCHVTKKASEHPHWRGGRYLTRGYVKVYMPNWPSADSNGGVYEHRYVVECALGRQLKPYEHVHHKNRDKQDNRLENLEVVSGSKHATITHLMGRIDQLEAFIRDAGLQPPRPVNNFGH